MLKAVLLDIDGTLVRSNDEHAQAWSEALERFGYHVPWADIRGWIGMGGDKILPRVDKRLDDKTKPGSSIARLSRQIFLSIYLPRVKPQPGARALLAFFKSRSLLRVAATSAKRRELDAILQAGEIADGSIWRRRQTMRNARSPTPILSNGGCRRLGFGATKHLHRRHPLRHPRFAPGWGRRHRSALRGVERC